MDAQLVFDADAFEIIAAAIGEEFGTQEQADALGTSRCFGQPGEDEMDDIAGDIMFAPGDVDLGALDAIASVRMRLGA